MDKRSVPRAFFRLANRFIVVPAFQYGLGRIIPKSLTGDIMVLGIASRKTGNDSPYSGKLCPDRTEDLLLSGKRDERSVVSEPAGQSRG